MKDVALDAIIHRTLARDRTDNGNAMAREILSGSVVSFLGCANTDDYGDRTCQPPLLES